MTPQKGEEKNRMKQNFFVFSKKFVEDIIMSRFNKSMKDKMLFQEIYITCNGDVVVTWYEDKGAPKT